MARKAEHCNLLDTSAVIYQLHGHTLQRAAVADVTVGGTIEVPVFVRMEYLRGVIVNLIEMFTLIKESVTVEDALIDWSQQIRQERYAGNAGFLHQAEALDEADSTRSRTPSCRWCARLGDALIALQTRRGIRIVTADRTFAALGELLSLPVVLLPSLAELKRREFLQAEV
jgi:predicted nucleic acid-binding protein